jgi:hypothetical protein
MLYSIHQGASRFTKVTHRILAGKQNLGVQDELGIWLEKRRQMEVYRNVAGNLLENMLRSVCPAIGSEYQLTSLHAFGWYDVDRCLWHVNKNTK